MKKLTYIIFILLLIVSMATFILPHQKVSASDIGTGIVGIENKWGIGYKIKDRDTIPLLAFDEPGEPIRENNSEIAQVNQEYEAYKDTVNIYVNDIKDLFFVVDLYYGVDDNETFSYRGFLNLPINNPYFFNFSSSDEIFNSEIENTNGVRVFDFDENIEINDFEGMTTLSQKSILFNFETMVVESKRNQNVYEFKLLFQNSGNLLHTITERRRELNIVVVVDNEKPEFYPSYNLLRPENPIDTSNPIYTKDDFVFRVYDKVNDNSNQVSRYSCTKDGVACLNTPLMPQVYTSAGFVPEIRLSENGSYILEIEDLAGNRNNLQVVIDKNAPIIESFIESVSERNIINNGAYSNGIILKISDNSVVHDLTVAYKYNDVRQEDIKLDSDVNTIDDIFINFGKYEILYVEDFLGNRALFSNNSQSITFYIDNLGPYYDGNVELFNLDDIKYNTSNVRLRFFDDEFGSGLFTTTYYHIVDGVEMVKTLPNQDIFGYYLFSQDAHHKVVIKDKALNELIIEFIIDKTPPSFEAFLNQEIIYLGDITNLKLLDSISGLKLSESTVLFNDQNQPTTLLNLEYEISKEGKYKFNLTDNAGNESEIVVYLDLTRPTISTQSIINNIENEFYNQIPKILYNDGEFGSGIKSYFTYIDEQWVEVQKRDIDNFFNNRISGLYQFKVIDFMNLESDILTINFDQTKPELLSDIFTLEDINYFNNFELVFSIFEDYSGIEDVKIFEYNYVENIYVLKHSDDNIETFNSLLNEEKEGRFKVEIIDKAQNTNIYEIYFDRQAPILKGIDNESYVTNWLNNFELYFDDENSGIEKIEVAYENQAYGIFISFLTLIQEGQYRFKVYDKAGNFSEFTLFYDYVDPTIEGIIPNAVTNETITLFFDDSYSGFDYATIKLNDEIIESNIIVNTYQITIDGIYEIEVFDFAGRSSTVTFIYDTVPPLLELDIELDLVDKYVFNFIGSDALEISGLIETTSDIQQLIYRFDGEDKDEEFPIVLGQGTHYFEFEDIAGNISKYTFLIDINDLPYLITDDTRIDLEIIYINQSTQFNAMDEISGIQSVILNGDIQNSNSFSVNQNGTYLITLIDNSNLENKYTIVYDDVQPTFEIAISNDVLKTSKFSVYDLNSGIFTLEYRQDLDSEWIIFSLNKDNEGFIVENGQYYFRLLDKAGNVNEISFIADIVFSNVTFNGTLYSKENNLYVFTSPVSLDFTEIQESFEVEYYNAKTLDGITIENDTFVEDGEYLISVTNEFNNTSVYKIIIDQTPIQLEVLENTFLSETYELEFGDDFSEISLLKVFYCENYKEDSCEDVSNDYLLENRITFELEGRYLIEVYDTYENKASTSFTIDKTSPILNLVGSQNIIIEYLSEYQELGVDVLDNFDTDLIVNINGSVDTSVLGLYIIEYQATDRSGNQSITIFRNVEVKDLTIPIIEINGESSVILEAGNTYVELGAKVTDNYDGNTVAVIGGESVDTTKLGTYIVTYDYTDTNNNVAETLTREVIVIDTINPEIKIINHITEEITDFLNQNILINHAFRVFSYDSGTGVKSVTINGNVYTNTPIILSGNYVIEVIDFANNKTTLNVLLDMVNPIISINNKNQIDVGVINIFGVNQINCNDELSEVQCYVDDVLFEENEFLLYVPGFYRIKAIDALGNESNLLVEVRLPFNQVKSLFWYELDNNKFKQISEILEYVKTNSKFEYQKTNIYSFNDLTTLRYDIREIPEDKTSKLEFYLVTYDSKKYAFRTESKLDEVITGLITQDAEMKYYNNVTQNYYEFENDFYVNSLIDINELNDTYLEIKDSQGIKLFEGLFNNSFQLSEQRYQIILKDERFENNKTYGFYLTVIENQSVTFSINNLDTKDGIEVSNNQSSLQFKSNIEILVGNYPFDITVEILEYNILESIKNTILNTNRYSVTTGSLLSIGNSGNQDVSLLNNKTYVITIYYIDNQTNAIVSKSVELNLLAPDIQSVNISTKEETTPSPAKYIIIEINEETLDLYYITEVYVEYCEEENCESSNKFNIENNVVNGQIRINQSDFEDQGYYKVVVKDSMNEVFEYIFVIDGSSNGNILWIFIGIFGTGLILWAGIIFFKKLH